MSDMLVATVTRLVFVAMLVLYLVLREAHVRGA